MPPSPRVLWVEYAKAIGIVLVVYGHAARGAQAAGLYANEPQFLAVDSMIYSFHMPLFFFLSGLFFNRSVTKRGPARFVANKMDTLFYPYVIWSVLQGSIESLLTRWTNGHATFADITQLLWHPRAQLWFLYALLAVSILAAVLPQVRRKQVPSWILLTASAAFVLKDHNLGLAPVASVMGYFVFFVMGVCFETSGLAERAYLYRWKLLMPCVGAFVLAQVTHHLLFAPTYKSASGFALALAVVAIAAVVAICMCLADRHRPLLALLGSASLVIYLLHILVASGTRIVLANVFHLHELSLILAVGTVLGVLIPVAIFMRSERLGIRGWFAAPPWLSVERLIQPRAVQPEKETWRDAA